MVYDYRVGTALGLATLARVVDDKGVYERHVAQKEVGEALVRQAYAFSRQPLERAVLAYMHNRVSTPTALFLGTRQPAVKSAVVMGGWQVGRVVDGVGVHAVATRRLQTDKDASQLKPSYQVIVHVAVGLMV